jgi:hypothetical protein
MATDNIIYLDQYINNILDKIYTDNELCKLLYYDVPNVDDYSNLADNTILYTDITNRRIYPMTYTLENMDLEKTNIPLKTVVTIVIYVTSLVGVYFAMKFKIDDTQSKVLELQTKFNKYNPEVMDYRLNLLQSEVSKLNDKADKIYNQIISKPE